jgi:hypothetical protein
MLPRGRHLDDVGIAGVRTAFAAVVALMLAWLGFGAGCSGARSDTSGYAVYPRYSQLPAVAAPSKYAAAIDAAYAHGLRVWIESDLVSRWRAGPAAFDGAVQQIAALARRPGVVGIKIADELGDRDGLDSSNILRFLHDSRAALHANAPGKLVLIDIIGYQLSCAPGVSQVRKESATCVASEAAAHPAVTLETIDRIVDSGYVDVIDLATNMADSAVYRGWGITRAVAEKAAFAEAHRRGWDTKVRLQTRKALAFPTEQVPDARAAAALVPDFVDVPEQNGVAAVDIWTFSQVYDGVAVHLADPGLKSNPLWAALVKRHRDGDVLFTHYSPTFGYGPSLDADMSAIATAFTDVFCAAGTG